MPLSGSTMLKTPAITAFALTLGSTKIAQPDLPAPYLPANDVPLFIGHYIVQACSADHHVIKVLFAMSAGIVPADGDQYFPDRDKALALMADVPQKFGDIVSHYNNKDLYTESGTADTDEGQRLSTDIQTMLDSRADTLSQQVHFPGVWASLVSANAYAQGPCHGQSIAIYKPTIDMNM